MKSLPRDAFWFEDGVVSEQEIVVATTRDELGVILGAIGQALELVDEREFHTLLGITPQRARDLSDELLAIHAEAPHAPQT